MSYGNPVPTVDALGQLRNAVREFDELQRHQQRSVWGLPYSPAVRQQQEIMVSMSLPPLVAVESETTQAHGGLEKFRRLGFDSRRTSEKDLIGNVVVLAMDQDGSRLVQRKLREGSVKVIFDEVVDVADSLMLHMYGNYVVQMLFEWGTAEMKDALYEKAKGKILKLAKNTFGCRILQQALKNIPERHTQMIINELQDHIMECIQDQNGNHVIQKCLEHIPHKASFVYNAFPTDITLLATHAYGCRVLQRILESPLCTVPHITKSLLEDFASLACNPYGNYVAQHLVVYGPSYSKEVVLEAVKGRLPELSKQKYASNVVEQMWRVYEGERDGFLDEYLAGDPPAIISMVKDKYGNYVVQQLLDASTLQQLQRVVAVLDRYAVQLNAIPSGKHILAKVDKKRAVVGGQKLR